jgi:hypothetical protein
LDWLYSLGSPAGSFILYRGELLIFFLFWGFHRCSLVRFSHKQPRVHVYRTEAHCTVQAWSTLAVQAHGYTAQYRLAVHCTVQACSTLHRTGLHHTVQHLPAVCGTWHNTGLQYTAQTELQYSASAGQQYTVQLRPTYTAQY